MSLRTLLTPAITQRLFSEQRLLDRRDRAERRRRARGERHRVWLFHQVDDPYSALLAAALPQLLERYDIELVPRLVGAPPDAAAPARDKLVAYSRRDAALLARQHGLAFEDRGAQPDAAAVAAASALLMAAITAGRFVERAGAVSAALWRGQPLAPVAAGLDPASPETVAQHVQAADDERERLGHYLGAMLRYGGEWYGGIDRLHHLERRLQALGAQRGAVTGLMFPPPHERLAEGATAAEAQTLDFFVSLRSPYSAIATPRVFDLARRCKATVRLRYVLPMVMRGLPVPRAKRQYISHDAAREARLHGVPFGRLNDPIGRPTERGLAVLARAERLGLGEAFLRAFMHGVWAEGVDAGSDRGLRRLAERAGLPWHEARAALGDEGWRATAEANRAEMFALGLWGVPSFRVGELSVWGQDRLWAVAQALQGRHGR
jgi:2-hydroxychromene-2-carboxylate isomerase